MVPAEAVHVTDLSEVEPWTVAVNWRLPLVGVDAEDGDTVTETTVEPGAGDPAVGLALT
jgi:hypothetical protein